MIKKIATLSATALLSLITVYSSLAADSPFATPCRKGVFLTITGNIWKTTSDTEHVYEMSEQEFRALPASAISTATPWTARSEFVGPLLSEILERVEAKGKTLRFFAINDFSMKLVSGHATKYGMILATSRDGEHLIRRNLGPIFAVYPLDQHPKELNTPGNISSMVWQLCGIRVD